MIRRNLLPQTWLRQNLAFLLVPGAATAVAAYAVLYGRAMRDGNGLNDVFGSLGGTTVSLSVMLLVLLGWAAFAKPRPGGSRMGTLVVGLADGMAQVGGLTVATWGARSAVRELRERAVPKIHDLFEDPDVHGWVSDVVERLTLVGVAGILGAIVGGTVLAFYLALTNRLLRMHDNEAASAVASEKYKHFIRIRIKGGTARAWVFHVQEPQRTAALFNDHDPRPVSMEPVDRRPSVKLWDSFVTGVRE